MAVITFSREAHSGTQDLAHVLARRLGYRYVGRDELTEAVRARSGIRREPQTDESEGRSLSLWESLGEQLSGERETYVTALKSVVTELALADNVVIVGHGAGLFLNDMRSVVRVFVVAPMADRLARLRAEGVEDPARGRSLIEQQDRESAAYLRYLFGVDWLDPHQWDLVINTGRADPEAALDMLMHYTQSLLRDEADHADLERKQLVNRVEQALLEADLGVDKLGVYFTGDVLTLRGEALTQLDRDRGEALARSIVTDATIDNQIVLRPPSTA
ncbi:MAG: cytidylate kinase-like family protein [Chloroflexi bacterium]|nr:cytidylate kinase-like family protein [Chloroflexota bacterium]MBV9602723.1 cytidylate kinase-like family protein [Chloroflexota bacterium]